LKGNRAKSGTIKKRKKMKRETGYERRENQSIYRGRSRAELGVYARAVHIPLGKENRKIKRIFFFLASLSSSHHTN
jgi:hypothetical protein